MIHVKNVATPDEKISFERGEINLVTVGGITFARAVLRPGWRWSEDAKPAAGTESCLVQHQGLILCGQLHVRTDHGDESDLGPGDAHVVGPGHDAWVVGDDDCVILDFAEVPHLGVRVADCPCGVSFRIAKDGNLDHLIAAVQEHARGSHDHAPTREHLLTEIRTL